MGANSHDRVVPLFYTNGIGYKTDYAGRKIPGSEFGGEKVILTPEQAWESVYSEEGNESGHQYSGGFGSKSGMTVVARAYVDKDVLEAAAEVIGALVYDFGNADEVDESGARDLLKPEKTYCGYTESGGAWCSDGKVTRKQKATLADGREVEADVQESCPQCDGTGKRPLTDEERATWETKIERRKVAIAAFGMAALKTAYTIYDDKWGPAAALVGKDHVWFGGYCPS